MILFATGAVVIRGISLGRLAAMLTRCSLYVGNDSGITHLAAAAGAPQQPFLARPMLPTGDPEEGVFWF